MAPSEVDGAHAAMSNPLRGRDNELVSLHDHLARLRSGAGTSWLIEGGPGLGKSRLVEYASSAAQRCGFAAGHGVAEPGDAAVELAVLMDALFGGPEPLLDRSALGDSRASREQRYWLLQDIQTLLEQSALRQPILICLDDLQWADSGTGAALGAIGAAMLDMDRELGTFANAVTPGMGSASGAIVSALAVRFLPDPTHLIYLALIGVLALQATAIVAMRETVSRAPGALASLRPEITLPRALRAPVLTAVPVLFAVWALAGLYGALGPALVHALTGSGNVVLGSLSLFVLAASAVVATIVLRRAAARTVMLVGILALITGVAVTVAAVTLGSAAVFFAGSAIAGAGFGSGFQGGIRLVVPLAAAHERAGLVSLLYVVSYLGLGVPAVLAGFGVVHGGGLIDTARYYGAAVIALAALALFGLLKNGPAPQSRAAEPAAAPAQGIR